MAATTAPTDHIVSVNGLRLHYLAWGPTTAPAIVMLHGLRGAARTWEPMAAPLSAQYHVIALDQRGRGESDWAPDGIYTRESYVSDLEQVVDEVAPAPFVLIGHSMG